MGLPLGGWARSCEKAGARMPRISSQRMVASGCQGERAQRRPGSTGAKTTRNAALREPSSRVTEALWPGVRRAPPEPTPLNSTRVFHDLDRHLLGRLGALARQFDRETLAVLPNAHDLPTHGLEAFLDLALLRRHSDGGGGVAGAFHKQERKSTRLNSSHGS